MFGVRTFVSGHYTVQRSEVPYHPVKMPSKVGINNKHIIKSVKTLLEKHGILDKSTKISSSDGYSYIYSVAPVEDVESILDEYSDEIVVEEHLVPSAARSTSRSLESVVRAYLEDARAAGVDVNVDLLMSKLPRKWSIYTPMVLFNTGGFDSEIWTEAFANSINASSFFNMVRAAFPATITHFAINKPIVEEDVMRRPFNLVALHGDFGPETSEVLFELPKPYDLEDAFWCHVVQNGIYQTWAPRYTMFSRGNITEKKRVLDNFKNLKGLVVMDFYAGIGYFTLSYLANGGTLLCWELNPWSIEGLVKGLSENGYKYQVFSSGELLTKKDYDRHLAQGVRAFVFHESNENVVTRLQQLGPLPVSHINLGLLPSLQASWSTVKTIRDQWTSRDIVVHVHENEHKDRFEQLLSKIGDYFKGEVIHLEKVKTFAPDIWHVVVDVGIGGEKEKEN